MQRKIFVIVLLVLISISGLGIIFFDRKDDNEAVEKIKVADISLPSFAQIYIAEKKGFFKEQNLEIEYTEYATGRDALASVLNGNEDFATVYETPLITQILNQKDPMIIAELSQPVGTTGIIARKDRGILNPSDLIGKKIAVTKGTSGELFLNQFLSGEGIDPSKLTIVNIEPGNMVKSISNGDVDAVTTWQPYLLNSQDEITNFTSFYSTSYTEMALIAAKKTNIDEKKTVKFLKALTKADEYIKNNKGDSINIVIEKMGSNKTRLVKETWDNYNLSIKLDNFLLTVLKQETKFVSGDSKTPNFKDYIYLKGLKEVKPELVTIM